ncbi:MAG: hypothetical protein M1834_008759 [Cirrosporium novae-zelandiae]|nr:MAG: hypothetical protein M1834_008759 [Cirrosporium novae-zelandiae]
MASLAINESIPLSFDSLPGEIRNKIYSYILIKPPQRHEDRFAITPPPRLDLGIHRRYNSALFAAYNDHECESSVPHSCPAIFLVNHRIYQEASSIFYSQNHFAFIVDLESPFYTGLFANLTTMKSCSLHMTLRKHSKVAKDLNESSLNLPVWPSFGDSQIRAYDENFVQLVMKAIARARTNGENGMVAHVFAKMLSVGHNLDTLKIHIIPPAIDNWSPAPWWEALKPFETLQRISNVEIVDSIWRAPTDMYWRRRKKSAEEYEKELVRKLMSSLDAKWQNPTDEQVKRAVKIGGKMMT